MSGCRVNFDEADLRHLQVVVRGGYYFSETRVSRRDGSDALRGLKFTELAKTVPYLRILNITKK